MKRTLVLAALLLTSSAAFAGFRGVNGVVINTSTRYAGGNMSDARSSGDPYSRVAIELNGTASYQNAYAEFWDAQNHFAYCWTSNAQLISLLASAKSDAFVAAYWDASGQCTQVYVGNDTGAAPKAQ